MKIKIISKFGYQTAPVDETFIEVNEEDLKLIGISKCFDLEKKCVISYENKEEQKRLEALTRINELKDLLRNSDYKAIKYAEKVLTDEEYAPIKAEREAWRKEINMLESKYL